MIVDRYMRALTIIAVLALILSTGAVVTLVRQSAQREADRIDQALESCERGNVFREQVITVGHANGVLVADVVDKVATFAELEPAEREALAELVGPSFESYDEAVQAIKQVDCPDVIDGAPNPPTKELTP